MPVRLLSWRVGDSELWWVDMPVSLLPSETGWFCGHLGEGASQPCSRLPQTLPQLNATVFTKAEAGDDCGHRLLP